MVLYQRIESRKLQCPGYDKGLRWDQGVASRGKLKGQSQPVSKAVTQEPSCKVESRPTGQTLLSTIALGHSASPCQNVVDAPLKKTQFEDYEIHRSFLAQSQTSMLRQERWLASQLVSSNMSCRLQNHYQDQVAPKLQWIDAPSNPWRAVLLPLSRSSAALQFAILSFSATHLYVTSMIRSQQSNDMHDLLCHLRLKATENLNAQINRQLGQRYETTKPKASPIIEIIATMLVLCHIEMLMPGSKDWTLHLRACREVCDHERHSLHLSRVAEPIMDFFEKALADLEAFESPSSFMLESDASNCVLTQPAPRDRFWIFLAVVREVTFTERQRYTKSIQGRMNPEVDMRFWLDKVNRARSLAFSHPSFTLDSLQHLRGVFRMVANAHYYAGLVYAYQALTPPTGDTYFVRSSVDSLFFELQSIVEGEKRNFDHDLFWPLFIAGTESGSDKHRQGLVQRYYQHLMASTGFWCNAEALSFLEEYWAADMIPYDNWIRYARSRRTANESFLVY
ncbi:uncharacterized protein HMPREF1541_03443 [Cyphellophora europaea CBS 101466]|uniref:Uncharacterized protein n=1 Tax=Cyphellophora europaea (strain CBS 101466) TaxID=1220924 RepID=W2RYI9_CYPE1|nr:uncharacterized protein HMPREF1541_03443 [Cyphellophora europaea CBS 101466]ETN41507.1 hypothetical protein HMPREF1541_03443 [Cyphellophora europaea CBS 101466]